MNAPMGDPLELVPTDDSFCLVDFGGLVIAEFSFDSGGNGDGESVTRDQALSNARLFLAGQSMLAALRLLVEWDDAGIEAPRDVPNLFDTIVPAARRAVAEAAPSKSDDEDRPVPIGGAAR